jgi:hypothetical protein
LCAVSPCFRTWFTTCTFMKNPKTWWTRYKQYDISSFEKKGPTAYFRNLQPKCNNQNIHDTTRNLTATDIETGETVITPQAPLAESTPPQARNLPKNKSKSEKRYSYHSFETADIYPHLIFQDQQGPNDPIPVYATLHRNPPEIQLSNNM